jgi:uncharacterized protein (TIGR00369 family)
MHGRPGPFWDGVEGRAPIPPAAATLGFQFVDADVEAGTIEVAFTATEAFTNPSGNVLGAFLAAMLFDTVGPALLATLEPDQFQSTLQLGVSFLRPVRPGRLAARAGSSTATATWRSWRPRSSTATGPWSPPPPPPPG